MLYANKIPWLPEYPPVTQNPFTDVMVRILEVCVTLERYDGSVDERSTNPEEE